MSSEPVHRSSAKSALITGVTGQDGACLAEFLLAKGYTVHGLKRRSSSFNTERVDHLYHDPHEPGVPFYLRYGDVTDATNLIRVVQETQPDEIYNLAAQSHVQVSFETPEYTANADAAGDAAVVGGDPDLGREKPHEVLSGIDVGAVRQCRAKCRRPKPRHSTRAHPTRPRSCTPIGSR